jgi:murein DD-endopeptidase MepM/ murein hydrolase activator NlpD
LARLGYGGPVTGILTGGATGCWRGIAIVVVVIFVWSFGGALSDARTSSALRVEVSGAPQRVQGSDGREHLEYDLVITNAFTAEATLRSLQVRGDRRRVLSLSGAALEAATLRVGTSAPTRGRIEAGSTVVIQVDVVLPRSAGRRVPRLLTNRITYAIPANAPVRAVIGTTTVQVPAVRVDRRAPVVIASPLRGSGWLNANGCCGDPTAPHRNTVLATSDGRYITPEIFAIDWIRVVNGRLYTGDGTRNTDWPTYGAPLYAVANGTVVSAVDGRPDIPPSSPNLDLQTPRDFGGNSVLLRIGPGRYACYAHIKTGSVRVRRGQRVRVGQPIGLVGNSGNTTGPHLHFGIQRRPDCLSQSEPFEIDRYTLEGTVGPQPTPTHIRIVGPRRHERRSHPLITSVITLSPSRPGPRP